MQPTMYLMKKYDTMKQNNRQVLLKTASILFGVAFSLMSHFKHLSGRVVLG